MPRTMPHPVWVKRGATDPHNYNARARSSEDNHHAYTLAAQRTGKTIGDLLAECRLEELRKREIYAK